MAREGNRVPKDVGIMIAHWFENDRVFESQKLDVCEQVNRNRSLSDKNRRLSR